MAKSSRKPPGFRNRRLELHQFGGSGGEIALARVGIRTVDAFLSSVQTIRDRMLLSARTGLTSRQIRNMTALLEFQQLTGFDAAVVKRFQAVGVGTIVDLANQDPRELANLLIESAPHESPDWDVRPIAARVTVMKPLISPLSPSVCALLFGAFEHVINGLPPRQRERIKADDKGMLLAASSLIVAAQNGERDPAALARLVRVCLSTSHVGGSLACSGKKASWASGKLH